MRPKDSNVHEEQTRAANIDRWGLRCRCGLELTGSGEDGLVGAVNAHLTDRHPSVAGAYNADDILALAYRLPTSSFSVAVAKESV
ncbi:hypothetical protein FB565_003037 [Actinoplanes lutulentus]|uniref:DUF1059 domain-containing protein n=1 Tax=Actinoplanes lutulentus TaxID=1287878 RepID=A0A327Z304_9ACTN|nr:hypothetical protein [Actinoplanes lutulentus]MBB2943324.1 hypothetical protein [Actinoplanes lutulentus]RAK28383.1 hypothetical protein B0I29_120151 [Actinoplanes lutulentus]